jgi:hypothetical protein
VQNTKTMNADINNSLLKLRKRAEKYSTDQLVKTFVDVGPLFTMLTNPDHQILYGRRGTGKTHVLRYLTSQKQKEGHCSINIDLRTIGSTGGIYSDDSIPLAERATRLLVDALSTIHDQILDFALEQSEQIDLSKIGPVLDSLADSIMEVQILGPVEKEDTSEEESGKTKSSSFNLSPEPSFGIGSSQNIGNKFQSRTKSSGIEKHRVHFPSIQHDFAKIIKLITPYEIWIVLDEWAEIPLDLQPFLGDLIRRTLFPTYGITVKIGAIEHRSNFRILKSTAEYIGLEIGADVTSLNLDEYMVFDNNEYLSIDFFKNLIFKHLKPLLPTSLSFKYADDFVNSTFTQTAAFEEFVRASEGVPRDAINILVQAAMKAGSGKISINQIRSASRVWYNRDKEKAVSANPEALRLLRWIIDEVIGNRNARAFLLRTDIDSPLIEYLYDARVIHIIKQSIAGKDDPGVRYNVYSVDYGCYVDLINTSRAPKGLFEVETDEGLKFVSVPQNDYRAIRRAILNLDEFEEST